MIKIDKLFGDKKHSGGIYILLAVGIMLLVFPSAAEKTPKTQSVSQYTTRAQEAEEILSQIKDAGHVSVMICEAENNEKSLLTGTEKEEKDTSGVLIVADGGSDSTVREKLVRAASVALGVASHKIEVFERK